jgi:hypothetical protein
VRGAAGEFDKAPLYAVARVCALDALRARARARPVARPEREGHHFTQIDAHRLSDPSAVLFDRELIELVWDSAAALTPDEYSLLDLHIRRDLAIEELAYHCGLGGSAAAMLSRLCRGLDDVVISTLVATRWRRNCTSLDLALSDLGDPDAERVRWSCASTSARASCARRASDVSSRRRGFSGVSRPCPPHPLCVVSC